MATKKTYLLPENPSPANDRCLIVFYPDDIAFQRAVLGSLVHLEKWVAWDRDTEHTALVVSQRMKQANQRTLETLEFIDCEFLQDLIEDGNMAVNVTNNIECGCGCGNTIGSCPVPPDAQPIPDIHAPPELYEQVDQAPVQSDPVFAPPPGFETRAEYLAYKCKIAYLLAQDIIDTVGNFQSIGGIAAAIGIGGLGAFLAGNSIIVAALAAPLVLAGFTTAGIAVAVAVLLFAATIGPVMFAYFGALHTNLATHFDDLVCDLYSSVTTAEARQKVTDRFVGSLGELVYEAAEHEDVFTTIVLRVLTIVLPDTVLKVLFASLSEVAAYVEEQAVTYDCSACDEPSIAPTGMRLVPAVITETGTSNGGSSTINGNTIDVTGPANASVSILLEHDQLLDEWYGILLQVVSETGNWVVDIWGASGGGGFQWENVGIVRTAAFSPEDAELESWAELYGYEFHDDPQGTSPPNFASPGPNLRLANWHGSTASATYTFWMFVPE